MVRDLERTDLEDLPEKAVRIIGFRLQDGNCIETGRTIDYKALTVFTLRLAEPLVKFGIVVLEGLEDRIGSRQRVSPASSHGREPHPLTEQPLDKLDAALDRHGAVPEVGVGSIPT